MTGKRNSSDGDLTGACARAFDVLRRSLGDELCPETAALHAHASALRMIGRPGEAFALYAKAIETAPDTLEPVLVYAFVVLARENKMLEAAEAILAHCLTASKRPETRLAFQKGLMQILADLGRLDEAVNIGWAAASENHGAALDIRRSVAGWLIALGRPEAALHAIELNLASAPEDQTWAYLRGLLLERIGRSPA